MNKHIPKKFEGFEIPRDPNVTIDQVGSLQKVHDGIERTTILEGVWVVEDDPDTEEVAKKFH